MSEDIATSTDAIGAGATGTDTPDIITGDDGLARCRWCDVDDEYRRYHDEEWGVPQHDDRALFEKVCLEGFQAGLSWHTILKRRDAFREAFHGFDIERVAAMTEADVESLLTNAAIIRHRGKITATIGNARATLALPRPLHEIIWSHAPKGPRARPVSFAQVPAVTQESEALSRTLRAEGFRFVGPTTMYALMQATGVVDDHVVGCWRSATASP